jgi:hypothetical protein
VSPGVFFTDFWVTGSYIRERIRPIEGRDISSRTLRSNVEEPLPKLSSNLLARVPIFPVEGL